MSSTIWALTDATSAVATQRIPVATAEASGSNAYITPAYLAAYVAAAMTAISITGGTVTSSTPVLDATQTWSTTATYTGIKLNITDSGPSNAASLLMDLQVGGTTLFNVVKDGKLRLGAVGYSASTPALSMTGQTGTGIAWSGNGLYFSASGVNQTSLLANALTMRNTAIIGWAAGSPDAGAADTILARDAANTLALRNGTNVQTQHIYGTYTDASNYTRLSLGGRAASSNRFDVYTENAGTGPASELYIGTKGSGAAIYFLTGDSGRWNIAGSTGHFLAATDNTYDIGASGAARPRNIQVGTNVVSPVFTVGALGTAIEYLNPGISVKVIGANVAAFSGSHQFLTSSASLIWSSGNASSLAGDTYLTRAAAATLQHGAADAAAPVAQTISFQSVVGGTSNTAGVNATFKASAGTGTGAGGSLIFQVAPAGSTGSAQNTFQTGLTIDSTKQATFGGGITLPQNSSLTWNGTNTGGVFNATYFTINPFGFYNYTSGGYQFGALGSGTSDLYLARDAANTLALRNSTTAQTFNIYNTYTDTSNYERGGVKWTSNALVLFTEKLGTGTARSIILAPVDNGNIDFNFGGANAFRMFASDNSFGPQNTANTFDLGKTTLAWRSGYFGTSVLVAPNTAIPAGGTAGLGYRMSNTSNFGVFFGSGAPSLSAAKGSFYLRSDGSTTNDRAYINTDGSTTWTALTTAA